MATMASIRSRLTRLEAMAPKRTAPPNLWVCHVRQGHEDEDRIAAFARAGVEACEHDIIIQGVHHRPGTWEARGDHTAKRLPA